MSYPASFVRIRVVGSDAKTRLSGMREKVKMWLWILRERSSLFLDRFHFYGIVVEPE